AAVAGIDSGIGLDEVLEADLIAAQFQVAAALGADNAQRDRTAQPKGAANRQDKIADFDAIAIADAGSGKPAAPNAQHGNIGIRVRGNGAGRQFAAVVQPDHDPLEVGVFDHVAVSDDIELPGVFDDDAAAGFFHKAGAAHAGTLAAFLGVDVD